jgi:hypothetical protein
MVSIIRNIDIFTVGCHATFALFDPFQNSLLNVLLILGKFDCFGKRRKFAFFFFAQKVILRTNFSVFFSFVQICLKIRKLAPFLAK